jgi:pyrroloquinoline quinone (PQQ) biosynthesis protein C
MRDYLRERSVQQLKESDPQSFLLPRLHGAAKVALAEIQYDEYGGGRPERLHQTLYARALSAAGLDDGYAAYVGEVSGTSLASTNAMSLFALNRRLLPAGLGHFAAFEASSALPSRRVASGIERLGMGADVAAYFHEHVEADAVHEQVAARDVCGAYVADHPDQRASVLFGAACHLYLEALSAGELLARWQTQADAEVAS